MYSLLQEIEVWYIIPAVRKELARILTDKYGFSYEKAGVVLGISKAAVSQYLSNKRAIKVCLNTRTKKEIAKSAALMAENPKVAVDQIQKILTFMRENRCSCDACKKYNKGVLDYCNCGYQY